jgi:superfamily I DNA/RNA helicase
LPYKKNPEGEVRDGTIEEIKNSDWVICRNLKPLVQLNLFFLDRGMKSFIKGIDIGIGLAKILEKTSGTRVETSLKEFETTINKEIVKMKKKGVNNPKKTEKIDNMLQKLEIMTILANECVTTRQLIDKIRTIFKETGDGIMLSTIHKTKGLENERIFFLLPNLIPNKFAIQEWNLEQEGNLLYVGITRAQKDLIYIQNNDFKIVTDRIKEILGT